MMADLSERLISQFDSLVPFLTLSEERVFRLLNEHRAAWFSENENALPEVYAIYRKQIVHSAFLLGYSYLESYLGDLIAQFLRGHPEMLPKDRKIDYSEVIDSPDKEYLINRIIQREVQDLFYKSMNKIIEELRRRYNFTITEQQETRLCEASLLRNCIMHNSSYADARLAKYGNYRENEGFELSEQQVHEYGLMVRGLVRRMSEEAERHHGQRPSTSPGR